MKINRLARSVLKLRIVLLLATFIGLAALGFKAGDRVSEVQEKASSRVEVAPPAMDISRFIAAAR